MGDNKKVKVLALHGYLQNAELFRKKTGSLSKGVKSMCDFVYIEAPFPAMPFSDESAEDAGGVREGGRSWWQWSDESATPVRPSQAHHYTGLDVMADHIIRAIEEHQPDGIVDYSRGLKRQQKQGGTLKFAILAGGFIPRDEAAVAAISSAKPCLNTLFITGENDQLVPVERTDKLMECFGGPTTKLVHPGGHCVPTVSGGIKSQIREFISAAVQEP